MGVNSEHILIVATRNRGKLVEIDQLLGGAFDVRGLDDLDIEVAIEETGSTFAENATIKAAAVTDATGWIALADDSGLEVDALGGRPGVYSARYGAPEAITDADRYTLLLKELADVPKDQRTARFRCAMALCRPKNPPFVTEGHCDGRILTAPTGDDGFGYDPVFFCPELGCSFAEASAEQKNRVSHRGRAVAKMVPTLRRLPASISASI